jgi:hypothetical protein
MGAARAITGFIVVIQTQVGSDFLSLFIWTLAGIGSSFYIGADGDLWEGSQKTEVRRQKTEV